MGIALFTSLLMLAISVSVGLYIKNKIWGIANKPSNAIEYARAWGAYLAFIVPLASIHLFIKKDFVNALVGFLINLIVFPLLATFCGYVYGQFKSKNSAQSARITSYTLLGIAFIGFIFAIKSLNDNHMFAFSAMAKVDFDIGIVLANYIGALIVPTCVLMLGLKLYKNSNHLTPSTLIRSNAVNDECYEKALSELNSETMKASTWAKALASSDGNDAKAKSLYIQLRVNELAVSDKSFVSVSKTSYVGSLALPKSKLILIAISLIVVAIFGYTFTQTNKTGNWTSYYKDLDGSIRYLDLSSIAQKEGYTEVKTGYDWFDKDNGATGFMAITYLFNCESKLWRRVRTDEYEKSYAKGFGRLLVSVEEPYKHSDNIWVELEQWTHYDSEKKNLEDVERQYLHSSPTNSANKEKWLSIISHYRSQLSLFDRVCKK